MDTGMEASTHIHDVASGEHEGIDPDAMRAIPVLKPPKRSFCPKCGSDIHTNTMLQWRKWRDSAGEVVSMQLEASMETALIQVASHYISVMQALQDERDDALSKLENTDSAAIEKKLRGKLEKDIRKELEKEIRAEMKENYGSGEPAPAAKKSETKKKNEQKKPSQTKKSQTKPKKSGGMFGAKKVKKKYDGEAGGKVDWFLKEALDTVYDPHGTGKASNPQLYLLGLQKEMFALEMLLEYMRQTAKVVSVNWR